MPQPRLIVDGYNLMHATGLMRERFGPGGLERSRGRLLDLLADLLEADDRARTVVVFDARGGDHGYLSTQHDRGMRIEFPSRDREADDRIEQLIAENSAPKSLLIVSGDRRLHRAIRRRRGIAETGPQFLARLNREREAVSPEREKPPAAVVSEREVAWWRRRIAELDAT